MRLLKLKKKKSKKEKTKFVDKYHVVIQSFFVLAVGIIVLVGLHHYEYEKTSVDAIAAAVDLQSYERLSQSELREIALGDTYLRIIQPIIYNIGIILIVLAVGSMLFEFFGYLQFYRKRIAEVFTEKELVDILDHKYKKDLKTILLKSIYKPDNIESEEFLNSFDNKINNVMESYYYNVHNTVIHCEIVDSDFIAKSITRTFEIKEFNSKKFNEYQNLMNITYNELNDGGQHKPFEMESIEINGKPIHENQDYSVIIENVNNGYKKNVVFKLTKPLEITDKLRVKMKYKTVVSIDDRNYSVKAKRLCKNMACRMTFDSNQLDVMVNGFKFSTKNDNNKFLLENNKGFVSADSDGWLLPGEGVAFTLFKK